MAITTSNKTEYVDLDFVFKSNPNTGDIGIKKQINSVKQSVLHILNTNHGEKVFQPLFGANLRQYLFENNGLITSIAITDSIKEAITNFEPRVEVLNVKVNNKPDLNKIAITVVVKIISTNQITNIATSLERLR